MRETYGILAGMLLGLSIGIAAAWAIESKNDEEVAELSADLNAYRTMAEWSRFEEGRAK